MEKNSSVSKFEQHLRERPLLADGATGSYLFNLTGRLSEINHVYECFNSDAPDLVKNVHSAYLRAGAQCLTTNTFGANFAVLDQYGEGKRVKELNQHGVLLARGSIENYRNTMESKGSFFILGSVGPPPAGFELESKTEEIYAAQIDTLLDQNVDALLLETFTSLADLTRIIRFIQGRYSEVLPIIAEMAIRRVTDSGRWNFEPVEFIQIMAELGVRIAGSNCCAPWDVISFLDQIEEHPAVRKGEILLSAMPNGGGFQRIGNRYMTQVNPEYMGKLSRTLVDRGIRLVGGCCEVHPSHIREMLGYIQSRKVSRISIQRRADSEWVACGNVDKIGNGPFSRKIFSKQFAVSVEILPPRGTSDQIIQKKMEFVRKLLSCGLIDAIDVTDGSRGIPLVPPADFIALIREEFGWKQEDKLELIPHFTCRDLNVMGLQSRLIGFYVQNIHNVLFITGDPPKMSPNYPRSTAVFDLNSIDMIHLTHSLLNRGLDFGERPLARHSDPRTHFTIGTGFEPESLNLHEEVEKLKRKIDAGADYVMTQPAFRLEALESIEKYQDQVAVLPGVMILRGLDHAKRISEVPGVVIPEEVFERLQRFEKKADQLKAGIELASEQIRLIHQGGWAGLYLMSPGSSEGVFETLTCGLT